MTDPRDERIAEQPAPVPNDEPHVIDAAIALIEDRRALGKERYKVLLQVGNGRDFGRDADEEMADWIVYWAGYRIEHARRIQGLLATIGRQAERIKELEGLTPKPDAAPCQHCAAGVPMSAHDSYHWDGSIAPPKCEKPDAAPPVLELEIFVLDREAMFVCGAWGHLTTATISEIETEVSEDPGAWLREVPEDAETVRVSAQYIPPQCGEEGRIEFPGYWDLAVISVKPVSPGLIEEGERALRGEPTC